MVTKWKIHTLVSSVLEKPVQTGVITIPRHATRVLRSPLVVARFTRTRQNSNGGKGGVIFSAGRITVNTTAEFSGDLAEVKASW